MIVLAAACQASPQPSPSVPPVQSSQPGTVAPPPPSPSPIVWPAIDRHSYTFPTSPWFIDPQHGFGLGSGCADKAVNGRYPCTTKVLASSDGGRTWRYAGTTFHSMQNGGPVASIRFADPLNGWIYGHGVYATHDGGKTWTREAIRGQFWSLTTAGGAAWATTSRCSSCKLRLFVSAAKRDSWARATIPPGSSGNPVVPLDRRTAFIVGQDAYPGRVYLYRTTNAGRTWRRIGNCDPTKAADSASVAVLDIDHVWLVCGQQPSMTDQVNHLYRTSDGGLHWQLVAANPYPMTHRPTMGNMPNEGYLPSFTALSPWRIYITPRKMAMIAFSDDGGTTWTTQLGDDGGGGYSLEFVNAYEGWALSSWGFFRTIDGGAHWTILACREELRFCTSAL
jgi:photosystem II stability/assembly factor-like uncharacterized protein